MKQRALINFLQTERLDSSLMIGFYGGGNYGDELLMEVLAGLLKKQGAEDVSIAYQTPLLYDKFHHEFGFKRVDMQDKWQFIRAMASHKHIIVGGGGLWGMDCNRNIVGMSLLLLLCRVLLRKKIYLLAVGYYNSSTRMGRIGAWCAAKAANLVLARDEESYQNFKCLQPNTLADTDIAWYIDYLNLDDYKSDLAQLEEQLHIVDKTLFFTLRRFRGSQQSQLAAMVEQCVKDNANKQIIIGLMEPRHVDPEGYRQLLSWQRQFPNLQIIDCGFNPLALFLFFREHAKQLIFIGPQFHGILSAHLNGLPYFPVAYDNKVLGLLRSIAPKLKPIPLHTLTQNDLQQFIDHSYKEA
ncbi:MAG: polysaccharide pyruvyl transferase family protein [Candidatus Saccharimonadales bacterium]